MPVPFALTDASTANAQISLSIFLRHLQLTPPGTCIVADVLEREALLDDWGAMGGGFEGAELCIRIEVDDRLSPVEPQPLRQVKLYLALPKLHSLGWVKMDYNEDGQCQLPAMGACVLLREKMRAYAGGGARRHFVQFSIRDHKLIFCQAVHLFSMKPM